MADMAHQRIAVALLVATVVAALIAASAVASTPIASAAQRPGRTPIHQATELASCPSRDSSASSGNVTVSSRPGATKKLVPQTPVAVLVCHYTGMTEPAPLSIPAPAFTLESQLLVSSAGQASSLAAGLDALPRPNRSLYACPADFGQEVIAWFRYTSGVEDPVTLQVGGCNGVTNGHVNRLGVDGSAVTKLIGLVPAPPPARVRVELRLCGGPSPGTSCHIGSVTCVPVGTCPSPNRAAIVGADGATAATLTLDNGTSATSLLIPGSYTVELLDVAAHAKTRTAQTKHVELRAGRRTTVVFTLPVP
jgi:hypothetical protein